MKLTILYLPWKHIEHVKPVIIFRGLYRDISNGANTFLLLSVDAEKWGIVFKEALDDC